jgi:hypothetical protein
MTKLTITVLLILGLVVLFPPANRLRSVGRDEMLFNEGYTFIATIGGPVQIRFGEWLLGVGTVAVLGGAVVLSTKKSEGHRKLVFWLLASTFVWGLAIAPFIRSRIFVFLLFAWNRLASPLKNYSPLSQWTTLLTYPIMCWIAALLLTRSNRNGATKLAIGHVVAGLAWIAYAFWSAYSFSRSFHWR